jgi:MoaA/NifB/PqqE/SkfB family radical SAM enzyme
MAGQKKDRKIDVPEKLANDIEKSRERLRIKKPKVYIKLMTYLQAEREGKRTAMSLLDFAFSFECNFHCPHCCAKLLRELPTQRNMSLQDVKTVADQADQLGIFIFDLIGGEPLVWTELDKIIELIDPSRFHISITTNGWLLDSKKAKYLSELGVDKVGISIDSGIAEEHDQFRNHPGSFRRTINAVENAKAEGIRPIISTVVTHQSIYTEGFRRLLEKSKELDVGLDLQCATVSGGWRGNTDVLINATDAAFLKDLRNEYQLLRRDVWSAPGSKGGCPAATRSLYIIPSGDVLPCIFIHISFGNVLKEPLSVIQERILRVREFREFTPLCLAGEDREFISRYLSKTFDKDILPLDYREVFGNYFNKKR